MVQKLISLIGLNLYRIKGTILEFQNHVICGVPQGSVVGPYKYKYDLPNVLKHSNYILPTTQLFTKFLIIYPINHILALNIYFLWIVH